MGKDSIGGTASNNAMDVESKNYTLVEWLSAERAEAY
jgi:hypothetical protein